MPTEIKPIEHTHNYPWKKVVHAFFDKLPDPKIPEVASVEVNESSFDDETQTLHLRRTITMINTAPWWFRTFFPISRWRLEETSSTDYEKEYMRCDTRNIDYQNMCKAYETSEFWRDPDDANKTKFRQTGGMNCVSWILYPLKPLIEPWTIPHVERVGLNAVQQLDWKLANQSEFPEPARSGIRYHTHELPTDYHNEKGRTDLEMPTVESLKQQKRHKQPNTSS